MCAFSNTSVNTAGSVLTTYPPFFSVVSKTRRINPFSALSIIPATMISPFLYLGFLLNTNSFSFTLSGCLSESVSLVIVCTLSLTIISPLSCFFEKPLFITNTHTITSTNNKATNIIHLLNFPFFITLLSSLLSVCTCYSNHKFIFSDILFFSFFWFHYHNVYRYKPHHTFHVSLVHIVMFGVSHHFYLEFQYQPKLKCLP